MNTNEEYRLPIPNVQFSMMACLETSRAGGKRWGWRRGQPGQEEAWPAVSPW